MVQTQKQLGQCSGQEHGEPPATMSSAAGEGPATRANLASPACSPKAKADSNRDAGACAMLPEASGLEEENLTSPRARASAAAAAQRGPHERSESGGVDLEAAAPGEEVAPVEMSARDLWKRRLYMAASGVVVVISIALGAKFGKQIFNAIIDAKDFFRDEPLSLLGYFSIFTGMSMLFVPYSPFCIAIGFIFGIYWGAIIEMCNIFISSSTIFVVGRYLFKDHVEGFILNSSPATANIWKGLMKYLRRDWREAAKMNILMCFIPMPYGMNRCALPPENPCVQ